MSKPKILAFAGSARKESFNKKVIQIAVDGAKAAGADVTLIDLADYPLPIFDEDVESEGTPENATKLVELFEQHDGLLISCPEYNSSITPLLKNTIDWVSRPVEGKPRLHAYVDKKAGIMAASPGGLGGLRGMVHVRAILGNIGVLVLPDQIAVRNAHDAFDDSGKFKDEKQKEGIMGLGESLSKLIEQTS